MKSLKTVMQEATSTLAEKTQAIKTATQESAAKVYEQASSSVQNATSSLTDTLTEKVNALKTATQEEAMKLFDSWLKVLPKFESYGLKTNALAMGFSISPSLEIELKGDLKKFDDNFTKKVLENESNNAIKSVFQAIRTTVSFYNKADLASQKFILVALKIQISPEIKVYIGIPEGQ